MGGGGGRTGQEQEGQCRTGQAAADLYCICGWCTLLEAQLGGGGAARSSTSAGAVTSVFVG
jgi:hypothetical protein